MTDLAQHEKSINFIVVQSLKWRLTLRDPMDRSWLGFHVSFTISWKIDIFPICQHPFMDRAALSRAKDSIT